MRHLLFPSKEQADAFIEDLRAQGVIQPEIGHTTLNRRVTEAMGDTTTGMGSGAATTTTTQGGYIEGGGTAEDAGEGAIRGTGVGAAVGTIAGAVATVATGGLGAVAVPVILGMTALGSGVGAGVGAIGGAAGVDETGGSTVTSNTSRYADSYDVDHEQHDRISTGMNAGGRAVAVEDNIPSDIVQAAAARHGGQFV